jgi:hypothetical protein
MIRKPHSAAANGARRWLFLSAAAAFGLCTAGAALAEERGATLKEASVSGDTDKPLIRDR